jgi:hypothetical protein
MTRIIHWLGQNKLIALLLAVIIYFSIVTFHDEITDIAIRIRNSIGLDSYNSILAYGFLVLLIIAAIFYFKYALEGKQRFLKTTLTVVIVVLMVLAFRLLMVYNIEAIHFAEYMLLAMILLPVFRNYRETIFWVNILGILDELFQYLVLTPNFDYFDFNDCILNLLGAGAGAIMIFNLGGEAIGIRRIKWYRSPAFLTGVFLLVSFFILLWSGKMVVDPSSADPGSYWFSINRVPAPGNFWTEAYPGRRFHILSPAEGVILMYILISAFSFLDVWSRHVRKNT